MDLLKSKLGGLAIWKDVEAELAMSCAELPEPTTPGKQEDFIKKLKKLKKYLFSQEVPAEELVFLDEEIETYEKTKTMSLYEEEEDQIDESIINSYARLGKGTEGVVGIHHTFNYTQLKKLTNGVYRKTGLIKFYISQERTVYGKIVAEIYEHSQKIPIATLLESRKLDFEGTPVQKRIALFGEKINKTEWEKIKEINIPFYVYRFITEKNDEMILISATQCEIGDYIVTGVLTQCDDYKDLTDSAKLPTKLPFFFAQMVQGRIIRYKNHEEFFTRAKYVGMCKKEMFDFPFTISKDTKTWRLLQPNWYKWLIWSLLTHAPKGLINSYPLHLLQIGPKNSGKSLLLNSLHAKSKETRSIFSGSSSTLKHLVPSFKYNPAKLGYLAESNRFSFCDEFLRCLVNTRTTKEGAEREEGVAIMNDLLEHQKRLAGSGVSQVHVNMTSRIFAMTNPVKGIKNVEDLINHFDESFLSRWIIYFQPEEHVQMIRKSKDSLLDTFQYYLDINDWISFIDYLHTFPSEYSSKRVEEIYESVPEVLSENLKKHYDARHMHHIECIMDGIVKTRCMIEGDSSFTANEEDYKVLKDVWLNIIGSWINPEQIRNIKIENRIFYLPENCQFIYWKMDQLKKPVTREQAEELALKGMDLRGYYAAWGILLTMGLIKESDGKAKLWYFTDDDTDESQQRLRS